MLCVGCLHGYLGGYVIFGSGNLRNRLSGCGRVGSEIIET